MIEAAGPADAGELLTLQRAAYVTEGQLYDDVQLPALTQSLAGLHEELASGSAWKALRVHRIVGAVRTRLDTGTLHIGRLTVAPDQQRQGIGSALLLHVEAAAGADVTRLALFTGHLSEANLRLYERHGYTRVRDEVLRPGVTLVHLEKAVG